MSDWIKDLGEQNTMLVHTVEDLEQAASSKVKLLEDKLKQSSQIMDNFARSDHSEEVLQFFSLGYICVYNFVTVYCCVAFGIVGSELSFESCQSIGKG